MSDTPDLRGLNGFVGAKFDEIGDELYEWFEEKFDNLSAYD